MEKNTFSPFLSFNGAAEEAMSFYASALPDAAITKLIRYGKDHPMAESGDENRVLHGAVAFKGREILFLDMTEAYPAPGFNWAMSLYVECVDEGEFDTIFNALSQDGTVMMGPEPVAGFRKCAWVTDKFGITWQPVWE